MDEGGDYPFGVRALTVYSDELIAGGNFTTAGEHVSAYWARWARPSPCDPGDLNCDGAFNGADIDPFFLALGDPAAYAAQFPSCDIMNGDMNCDGAVNGADIDPFFTCLGQGGCTCP